MKKLKELLSDTLVYGISSVLARFINYLLVPLHTDVFSTSQYGIVSLVFVGIAFLNVVFTFGMESAYLRYAKDRSKAKDVFRTLQLGLGGLSSLLILFLILSAPFLMPLMNLASGGHQSLYWMMLGILWFDTMALVPFAELRLVRKQWLFAGIRTGSVLINLGLNFYLILALGWGIEAVFFANLAASGITALVVWALTANMLTGSWSTPVLKRALNFGLPFIPAGLGYVINEMLDRFFLANYMSQSTVTHLYGAGLTPDDIVGIYSACYKISVFMLLLVQMFRMAWQPFFLRHSDDSEAKSLYRDVFRYFSAAAGVCFLIVAIFAEQIVQIKIPFLNAFLVGREYWMGLHIVPFLLGAYWFQGWYMNFSAGIFIKERTKILPVITLIGAGITIIANLILIPHLGMLGSATATLLSYAVMAMLLYYKSVQIYPVRYQLIRAFLMMAIATGCLIMIPEISNWIGSEWTGRFLVLIIGSIGIVGLSIPNYFESK
ncbi:MAG: polysaccharide biosynthesis C-terminal domain-containing protein [Balneolaceae bacterium]